MFGFLRGALTPVTLPPVAETRERVQVLTRLASLSAEISRCARDGTHYNTALPFAPPSLYSSPSNPSAYSLGLTALLDKANLTLDAGERLCLMGRNGAGKSTLLKVIAGEVKVDGGEIQREQDLRVTEALLQ